MRPPRPVVSGSGPSVVGGERVCAHGVISAPPISRPLGGGIGDRPARLVVENRLAVIVSDYQGPPFGELPKEELLRCLLAHQRVLESLILERAVLPLEFGTMFESDSQTRAFLAGCGHELSCQLERLGSCLELEVAVTWEVDRVLAEISREAEVASAREAISAAGEPSLEDRARLGRLVKARLDQRREEHGRRILELLRPRALEVAANPLLSDELVANLAFLVERSRRAELEVGVRELDQVFEGRLTFRIIGPMPPYTFSTVGTRRVSRQQIAAAGHLLELKVEEPLAADSVRNSYRRLAAAAQAQPERLGALREACDLLVALSGKPVWPGRADPWLTSVRRPQVEDIQPSRFGGGVAS